MISHSIFRTYAVKVARAIGYAGYITCVMHCVTEYIGNLTICEGQSMEPTIHTRNVVVTERVSVKQHSFKRGDIIIAKSPYNPRLYICKRVKGIPGDKIKTGFFSSDILIPKGHVWLEGDNSRNSTDSRDYGPVPQGLIKGRVLCIVWPLDSVRKLTSMYVGQST